MGIRLNSDLIVGVRFSHTETKAVEKFMSVKGTYWFLMRWIEEGLKAESAELEVGLRDYSNRYLWKFAKRAVPYDSKKNSGGNVEKPYRPFWSGCSKKFKDDVEKNLLDRTHEYLLSYNLPEEAKGVRDIRVWFPEGSSESQPANMFGVSLEHNYAMDIDYALMGVLKIKGMENKVITVPGTRPWECGTAKDKKGGWYTCNGQHMIPARYLPKDTISQILWHSGTKKSFIKLKEEIWDKYHGDLLPYKNYPCEGWNGSDFYFYPVDTLFRVISKYVPAVKYDVMRLEKYLCFYWC